MKKQKGLTLIEVLVIIAIIAMLLAILMPARSRVKYIPLRVVCGTHLKGLGTAMIVYANDYDDCFPQLPGTGPWSKELGFSYDNPAPDFTGAHADTPRTITSSWFLLVREADISLKSFVCPSATQIEFEGENPKMLDLVELRDFGPDPYSHVSYCMHNPYGKFPSNGALPSTFAVVADMSSWFQDGLILKANQTKELPPQIINSQNETTWNKGNSLSHKKEFKQSFLSFKFYRYSDCGFGQNVLFADGHAAYEKAPNIGVSSDNIYTYWTKENEPSEQDIQGGTPPTERNPENDAKSKDDSFLVL
jgi:prepilin-type processing-associated H-X9-DG protein